MYLIGTNWAYVLQARWLCVRGPGASLYLTCDQTKTAACWELAAHKNGFWPRTAAAVRPAAALKTPVQIPQGEYEEEMRLPSAGGTGDRGHCCTCAGPGALFLLCAIIITITIIII